MKDYYVRAAELAQDAMTEIAELEEKLAEARRLAEEWREWGNLQHDGVDSNAPAGRFPWEEE